MTDRPIIFSGPMIRALLDGHKTQTRRVLKPQPTDQPAPRCAPNNEPRHAAPYLDAYCGEQITPENPRGMSCDWHWWQVDDRPGLCVTKTSAKPGDRLWVREAHALVPATAYRMSDGVEQRTNPKTDWQAAIYREGWDRLTGGLRWRPSIHMPRWASRLTLTVTDVRVQRVQEISEEDAIAEGIEFRTAPGTTASGWWDYGNNGHFYRYHSDPRKSFRTLWNSIHGPDAWNSNPWVAAYTFTVEKRNIDQ